ncbi:MAG: DUF1223 domain-containing protein [Pseudomonadota bacterium]
MRPFLRALAASLLLAATPTLPAAAGEDVVVVELFTTQGCSSCPPVDALMQEVARQDNVLVLSWAVSIWDYLGWKDTLSIPESNLRHRWYNQMISGRNMVYTPQVFIDGEAPFKGKNRKDGILSTVEKRRGDSSHMVDITLDDANPGQVDIALSEPLPQTTRIHVVYFDRSYTVAVGGGENNGRTITYTNVVRGTRHITPEPGVTAYSVDLGNMFAKNCDEFAVLVQDLSTGKMLAAARHRLKPARS